MTGVITWVVDCGDGVCIHLRPMTLSVFTNFQVDTITGIRDADFAKESLIDDMMTGFMKLDDIRGEFDAGENEKVDVTYRLKDVIITSFDNADSFGSDPTLIGYGAVHPDTPMDTHPNDNLLGHIGSGADALTNYRPEGFSEVEIHFANPNAGQNGFTWEAAADIWTNGGASTFNAHALSQKVQHGCFEMQSGFSTENLDTGLRSDNRFVIEPVKLFQGLDAGGVNYAEAVGLDSSTVDVGNKVISSLQPANEFI